MIPAIDRLVHEQVAERARETPDAIAVYEAGQRTSYGELYVRAERLTGRLACAGSGPGAVVAVLLPRGADLAASSLAALRAGAAYLPLDPANPPARLTRMIAAAGVRHVITAASIADRLAGVPGTLLLIDEAASASDCTADPITRFEDLAYVAFTSGSTGEPKGVMISHRSFANMVSWHRQYTALGHCDRSTMTYSPGFDAGIAEMWSALSAGAALYVPDRQEVLVPQRFQAWLLNNHITVGYASAALADVLLRLEWPTDTPLRMLMTGDDRLSGRPAAGLPFRLINNYGPTENTVVSTAGEVDPLGDGPPSIGRPVADAEVYVLDTEMRLVPTGTAGEIYLGGPGLACGYVGRPDLTADRFVPHPFASKPGQRLYRTGDLARHHADGSLDFLGRIDRQVKVRGFRVEPGEAAAAVRSHPQVAATHVTTRTHPATGEVQLVAYIVAADPRRAPGGRELREHVADRLPEYLVPSAYVLLDMLPQTVTGKVNERALPAPAVHTRPSDVPYEPPTTDLERRITTVWSEVLLVDPIGINDHFLDLGGHSLLAVRVLARIADVLGVDIPIDVLFAHPTVGGLAEVVATYQAGGTAAIPPVRRRGVRTAPLSAIQSEVWFLEKLSPGNFAYNTQTTLRVRGSVDLGVLAKAMGILVQRHEMLRTAFTEDIDGQARQVVHPAPPVTISQVDLSALPPEQRQTRLDELIRAESRRPFDLGRLPLFRWTAVRLEPHEYELLLVEHHLVHDGWSFTVLLRELTEAYDAVLCGRPPVLPALPVQYIDYAVWQREALVGPWLRDQLEYWREQLADAPPALDLPTDRPRPKAQTFRGDLVRAELPPALSIALRALARAEGVTLFTLMLSCFAVLLYRYTGTADLCIGSGFANRRRRETEHLIGMFVNSVVLRCHIESEASFRQLLGQVRDVVLGASANQDYPFAELTRRLCPGRDPAHNPFFQVMFSFHNSPMCEAEFGDFPATVYEVTNGSAKLDINVVVVPRADQRVGDYSLRDERITLLWEYNSDLFDRVTAERMVTHYMRLLEAVASDPDCSTEHLPMLDMNERSQLVQLGQGLAEARSPSVPELVVTQGSVAPNAVAVADDHGKHLTYGQLMRAANQLARRLRALGVGQGDVVGVLLPRSVDLVVAALGVLLAGAAYAPLDPVNPQDRLIRMITTARIRHVASISSIAANLSATGATLLLLDSNDAGAEADGDLPSQFAPDSPAYVIFTSGSTGDPKGVQIPHRAFSNFVAWYVRSTGLTNADRSAMMASPGFDATIMEIWPPLIQGGRVEVPAREIILAPSDLARWLHARRVTVAFAPTPLAEALLAADWPEMAPLRVLVAGGDRLRRRPPPDAGFQLVNAYGPTENTVVSTACVVLPDGTGTPPIGVPIDGTEVLLLDRYLQPVPVGVPGEIYLGGAGLALGYTGRADLTADRFVPHPFAQLPGQRLYRTGDLARWDNDGSLRFLGRMDHQIKVRGFRIEAGEIEAALRTHPDIADACLHTQGKNEDRRLVAYIIPDGNTLKPDVLRAHLSARLPNYMVPHEYVILDALPLSENGKVDRLTLPVPSFEHSSSDQLPADGLERWLAGVWQELLKLSEVGVEDNFFDLGGHSLLLAQVHRRLHERLGRDISIIALFEYPTIRSLARHLALEADADQTVTFAADRLGEDYGNKNQLARRRAARERSLAELGGRS